MTREIKFRVWDNEEKKFFEPTYEGYAGKVECLSISLTGRLTKRTFNQPAIDESCFEGRYILMQFTGLKDKNGKEVYESDILKIYYENNQKSYLKEVKWLNDSINKGRWDALDNCVFTSCEVVGNIFENSELLNN
tara:strand:- start:37 stop:441 length:405 start_codon:yes stop_codon:yes gene_type:complete